MARREKIKKTASLLSVFLAIVAVTRLLAEGPLASWPGSTAPFLDAADDPARETDAIGRFHANVEQRRKLLQERLRKEGRDKFLFTDTGEFDLLMERINNTIPTALIRLGDGENAVMKKQRFTAKGEFDTVGDTLLGQEMRQIMKTVHDDFLFGVPCYMSFGSKKMLKSILSFCSPNASTLQFTYATVMVDANYLRWKGWIENVILPNKKVVLLVNEEAKTRNLTWAKEVYYIPNNMVKYWEKNHLSMKEDIRQLARKYPFGQLFFISAGPGAIPIVYEMWKANPNNIYLDTGSSIDFVVKGRTLRGYARRSPEKLQESACLVRGGRFGKQENSNRIVRAPEAV